MASAEKKNVNTPDETRKFEKVHVDVISIGGGIVRRATFQPGWKWSDHAKPIMKKDWCEAPHFGYTISGRAGIKMSSGEEYDTGPGDVFKVSPGHDAWVVGNEPWIVLDWAGLTNYAKPK